jgi:predicted nucleic acid-binding Zn ribbon protein
MKDLSQLPAHAHCRTCGKAIRPGKNYCSSECETTGVKEEKRKKNGDFVTRFVLVAMLGIAILFVLLQLLSKA